MERVVQIFMKTGLAKISQTLGIAAVCTISICALTGTTLAQKQASFVAHKEFSVGDEPHFLAAGDLNGDGTADLVITESDIFGTQQVVELLGNRDGSFQAPVILNAGSQPKGAVVIADFNKDGSNDIAVTQVGGVVVLLGDGRGGFG